MAERREQLLAAFDQVEGGGDEAKIQEPEVSSTDTGKDDGVVVADPSAEGTPAGGGADSGSIAEPIAPVPTKEVPAKDKTGEVKGKAPEPVPVKTADPVVDRPPTGAKRATREHWDKLPADVRREYAEREAEIAQAHAGIQKTRAWENEFKETVTPYLGLIQAQNSTPMKAVKNLMHTAARLTLGTPNQKAAVVAEIIGNYSVDLRELNTVLEARVQNPGTPPPGANFNPTEVPAWAQPMLKFMTTAQQAQQTQAQRLQQEAERELQEMQSKPYWNELKDDVGLLMHRASEKNQPLSVTDAYAQALKFNPEIAAKVKAAEKPGTTAANPVSQAASVLARARNAASSTKGAPGTPGMGGGKPNGKTTPPKTRRELLAEKIDELSGN